MPRLRLTGAALLPMTDEMPLIPDGLLVAEDGVITYAGAAADYAGPRDAEQTLDGEGCVAIPGLINAHTHCAMTLLRGAADDMPLMPWLQQRIWPAEERLEPDDVYWGVLLGALEMLSGGVTCFNDMYHEFRRGTQAAIDSRIRACPSGVLLGFRPNAEDLLDDALEFTRDLAARRQPRIHPMLGPHAPYTCPDHLLVRVLEGARQQGIGIHIHISETQNEVRESVAQYGVTPVRRLHDLGLFDVPVAAAHCVHLTAEDLDLIVAKGVGVVHNPGSNMKLGSGFAPVPELLQRGAIVGLGTDGAASNNNLDVLEEVRLAAILHKGYTGDPTVVTAAQALRMATRGSAAALGLDDLIGALTPGRRADVALIRLKAPHLVPLHSVVSHLVYAARAGDVQATIVDGEVVYEQGRFPHLDAEEIMAQAAARGFRLVGTEPADSLQPGPLTRRSTEVY